LLGPQKKILRNDEVALSEAVDATGRSATRGFLPLSYRPLHSLNMETVLKYNISPIQQSEVSLYIFHHLHKLHSARGGSNLLFSRTRVMGNVGRLTNGAGYQHRYDLHLYPRRLLTELKPGGTKTYDVQMLADDVVFTLKESQLEPFETTQRAPIIM
jgi:hypothetical protein